MMKNRKRTRASKFEMIMCGSCGVMLLWFLASWNNVVAHNMTDQCYAWWNILVWIFY